MTRPGRRSWALAVLASAAVAAGGGWAVGGAASEEEDGDDARRQPTATVRVSHRDLIERESFAGTLGYADSRPLLNSLAGTITSLRPEGSFVRRGQALYHVDGEPVALMYGRLPAWRTLSAAAGEGADVRQLEANLAALCYDPGDVDGDWDSRTTAAVKRWQRNVATKADGVVNLGEVVFLPGPRRIGSHKTTVGGRAGPGTPVMDTTSRRRIVTLELDARRQTLVARGDRVVVELPSGRRVEGRIVGIGKVAKPAAEEESGPTIEIEISVPAQATGELDQAPVDVEIVKEQRRNVLTVPVTALVALAGGGYAVEVDDNGVRRLLRVQPGLYADGLVEVSGRGLRDGMRVVVSA